MTENLLLTKIKKSPLEKGPRVLVIGFFDGVHLGHRYIIEKCVKRAKELDGISIAMTFDRPPVNVLSVKVQKKLIIPYGEKIKMLGMAGLDYVVTAHINKGFLMLTPAVFCNDILLKALGISGLYIGQGFRFGYEASGNVEFLKDFFKDKGVEINEVPLLKKNGTVISSTVIRESYRAGDIGKIASMLGRDPYVTGTVIKGDGRGMQLGFPTANVKTDKDFISLGAGVYLGAVSLDDVDLRLPSIINIGYNPTFGGNIKRLESYIIDFESDIYGKRIKVYFYKKIREEKKFENGNALREQMGKDLAEARGYFKKRVQRSI
ncbi:MAG: riboflavin biosynthesis protein RibF [Actinobacteria bacterium]|nr:riboflavin biosynthesis protein RibF [Actinomycetota bacterium]